MANFSITANGDCLQGGPTPRMGLVQIELLLINETDSSSKAIVAPDATPTFVAVDKLMLEPGDWGRFHGLHVRHTAAACRLETSRTLSHLMPDNFNAIQGSVSTRCRDSSIRLPNTFFTKFFFCTSQFPMMQQITIPPTHPLSEI